MGKRIWTTTAFGALSRITSVTTPKCYEIKPHLFQAKLKPSSAQAIAGAAMAAGRAAGVSQAYTMFGEREPCRPRL